MKQKDILLIVVVVVISATASFFISNLLISPGKHTLQAQTVSPITSEFDQPDSRYFNSQSVDPTLNITIGGTGSNTQPFNNSASQ